MGVVAKNRFSSGVVLSGRENGGSTVCMLQVGSVWQTFVPPPFLYTKTQPRPTSAPRPSWQEIPHTNKHLDKFVLVDVWLLFFSKKVNLWQTYRGNTYVDQL